MGSSVSRPADAETGNAVTGRAVGITGGGAIKRISVPRLPSGASKSRTEDHPFIEVCRSCNCTAAGQLLCLPRLANHCLLPDMLLLLYAHALAAAAAAAALRLFPVPCLAVPCFAVPCRAVLSAWVGGHILLCSPAVCMPIKADSSNISRVQETLNKVLVFNKLEHHLQRRVVSEMYERSVNAGEILIKEGDTGLAASELYVVKSGKFEVWIHVVDASAPRHACRHAADCHISVRLPATAAA
jgi:hypothetical protein